MNFDVLLVTDPRWSLERVALVARACGEVLGERFAVQVRDKGKEPTELAHVLREVTTSTGSPLIINGHPALARAVGADGLHGIETDGWFSLPVHDDVELAAAIQAGARAVLVSPIFASPGKGEPRGISALTTARASAPPDVRVVALGGVDETNAAGCRGAGADAVAVIRALLDAPRPSDAALRLAGRPSGW